MNVDSLVFFQWHILIGTLFVLSLISYIIYRYSKERSFLYYGFYTTMLLVYILSRAPYEDLYLYNKLLISQYAPLNYFIQILYYMMYSYFVLYFLDVPKLYPKLFSFLNNFLNFHLIFFTILGVVCVVMDNFGLYDWLFKFFYAPTMLGLTLFTFFKIWKGVSSLKYYVLVGTLIYVVFAFIALYFSITKSFYYPLVFFYFGVIVEQLTFAVGLANKVKQINEAKEAQFEENQQIKANQNKILQEELKKREKEILKMTALAEQERFSRIQSTFQSKIQRLQLISLQNQMKPHFVFNVLNSIKVYLIDDDKENAIHFLNSLSVLMRKVLESTHVSEHSLKEELEILDLYISIENLRFETPIQYLENLIESDHLANLKIPPLILQPFIENSLWHGLTTSANKEKIIQIETSIKNNVFELSITDNGIGRDKAKQLEANKHLKKKSLGISLSQQRFDYFNKERKYNYQFYFTDLVDTKNKALGTKVTFLFDTDFKK